MDSKRDWSNSLNLVFEEDGPGRRPVGTLVATTRPRRSVDEIGKVNFPEASWVFSAEIASILYSSSDMRPGAEALDYEVLKLSTRISRLQEVTDGEWVVHCHGMP